MKVNSLKELLHIFIIMNILSWLPYNQINNKCFIYFRAEKLQLLNLRPCSPVEMQLVSNNQATNDVTKGGLGRHMPIQFYTLLSEMFAIACK